MKPRCRHSGSPSPQRVESTPVRLYRDVQHNLRDIARTPTPPRSKALRFLLRDGTQRRAPRPAALCSLGRFVPSPVHSALSNSSRLYPHSARASTPSAGRCMKSCHFKLSGRLYRAVRRADRVVWLRASPQWPRERAGRLAMRDAGAILSWCARLALPALRLRFDTLRHIQVKGGARDWERGELGQFREHRRVRGCLPTLRR